ncbi:MAG: SdpI family protein [Balneolaceae bacterium]
MSILETLKKEWFILVILIVPFFVSAYFWDELPDEVPTHFNIRGEADDWGPKWMVAYLIPMIGLGTYLMILLVPAIDPKKKIESAQKPVAAIRMFTSVFMVGIYAFVMAASLGTTINFSNYIIIGVGMLILIVGNYMNSIKPNYFIGIRTPWTLENEEVWKRTHRLSSKIWIVGGLLLMLSPLVPEMIRLDYLIYIIVGILAGIPLVYSYVIYKKLESES